MTTDDNEDTATQADAAGRVDASTALSEFKGTDRAIAERALHNFVSVGMSLDEALELTRTVIDKADTAAAADEHVLELSRGYAAPGLSLDDMSIALETMSGGKRGRSDLRRALTSLLTGATLTAQLAATHADDGRVYRWSRLAFDLDDRQSLAVDRAIAEAKANAGKSDADTMRAVADALRKDGFEDNLTDEGFLKIKVWAARTGDQTYSNGTKTWVETRTAEEVGAEKSLRSWDLKPFTDDHPAVLVVPSNWREFAVGSCGQDATLTPAAEDGEQYVAITILVGDLATLEKIKAGKLELSAGYTVVVVERDGRFFQTQILINHLALVEAGRAGPLAAIKIDGGAWQVFATTGDAMPDPTDSTTPAADQLDPETSEMLLGALAAYLKPETPEAGAAALEAIANIMGLEGARIMEVLGATMGEPEAEPAPDPEMEPEPEDVLEAVTLADGITAKMTADMASKWKTHMQTTTNTDAADALQLKVDEQATTIATLSADVAGLRRSSDKFKAQADENERAELIADAAPLCPDLINVWRECADHAAIVETLKPLTWNDGAITESQISTMRRAIVCDIDPDAAKDFARDHAEISHDNWDAYVGRTHARETRRNRDSVASSDPDTSTQNTDARGERNQRLRLLNTGNTGK